MPRRAADHFSTLAASGRTCAPSPSSRTSSPSTTSGTPLSNFFSATAEGPKIARTSRAQQSAACRAVRRGSAPKRSST
eukprot:9735495-Alexandrium_andersonii.AAC.1